jgi:hypothetical protein
LQGRGGRRRQYGERSTDAPKQIDEDNQAKPATSGILAVSRTKAI